tara:strand:- start:137 stop:508 length:372 start_codon:yes stop_codon:yes gene_type:complete
MDKQVAISLKREAEITAEKFSNVNRDNNFNGETFWINEIIPLSAQSAMVVYEKTTGKKALAHFIHIRKQKRWIYYFMGAAHFLNLDLLTEKYAEIEEFNFHLNFDHIPKENNESNMPKMHFDT